MAKAHRRGLEPPPFIGGLAMGGSVALNFGRPDVKGGHQLRKGGSGTDLAGQRVGGGSTAP